jgi:hypothetical protein
MLDDDGVGSLILARMEWEWVMGAG